MSEERERRQAGQACGQAEGAAGIKRKKEKRYKERR